MLVEVRYQLRNSKVSALVNPFNPFFLVLLGSQEDSCFALHSERAPKSTFSRSGPPVVEKSSNICCLRWSARCKYSSAACVGPPVAEQLQIRLIRSVRI
jgi:hypothetical protein